MTKTEWLEEAQRLKNMYKNGELTLEEYNILRDQHIAKSEEIED